MPREPKYDFVSTKQVHEDRKNFDGNNDCTVNALAIATGMPYKSAYYILANQGRKKGKGMRFYDSILLNLKIPGYKFVNVTPKWLVDPFTKRIIRRKLREIVAEFTEGNYIVTIRGHAFALVNGVLHDWEPINERCEVLDLIKVETL